MATPIQLPWMNKVLGPPSPNSKVTPLPVFCDGRSCTSVWVLSDAEVDAVVEHRAVAVVVHGGATQPPISVSTLQTADASP